MDENKYDIAIIGAGASGLMLAANLDLEGSRGIVLEGSSCVGSKILMSGGGHCNITHGGSIKDFVYAYGDEGPALRRCLYRHSNLELAGWLTEQGVRLADENGVPVDTSYGSWGEPVWAAEDDPVSGSISMNDAGRIIPASMKSRDVLNALTGEAAANLWQIETNAKVGSLRKGDLWEVTLTDGNEIRARNVVIASGGITYPETGSDGSVFEMLSGLGLTINEPRPALAPVHVDGYPYGELSGISVPDVTVIAFSSDAANTCKGKAAKMKGSLLFTHEGFSGPVILNISKYVRPGETIRISYNKEIYELPHRMQRILRERSRGPLGDVRTNVLASLLDHDDFIVSRVDARGMVTAGGTALDEIDMQTMQVKRFKDSGERDAGQDAGQGAGPYTGLYVIGEALDADGISGGYNLQMCWSTACTCADDLRKRLGL